ncbi:hypothetical protein B0T14DRAFT_508470 [Immersiella caudata]|uniref:Uncharacterized protein n=1 Tax=Immersiella caudata TaxID=314043 RepID=A0AA40CE76_9PEZI|nr:hypothetical protein B0T14DRAFT_508470 [Immersiella caudata]
MAPYTISIDNRSGIKQSYGLFAAPPTIKHNGASEVQVATRIISSAHAVPSPQGQATFMMSKKVYARCGVYDVEVDTAPADKNRKRVGTGIEVVDQRLVTLGFTDDRGRLVPGTTLVIDSSDGTPAFSQRDTDPAGVEGCFCVRTGQDFTFREAKLNQFVVGFSCSARQNIGPDATFVPEPNEEYQIAPSRGFYVVPGKYNPYDIVSPSVKEIKSTCYVDFGALETDQVTLVHHKNGALVRQVVQDGELMPLPPSTSMGFMRAFSTMPDAAAPNSWIRVTSTGPATESADEASSTVDSRTGVFTPVSSRRLRDDDD